MMIGSQARLSVGRCGLVLAIIVVALPATADAPQNPPQYAQFDRDSTEINDNFTKLFWDRRRIAKNVQSAADLYCNATVYPGVGRAPTVKELLTLVDEDAHQEYDSSLKPPLVYKSIDQLAFPDTPADLPYWTSTPAGAGKFWAVDFTTGKTVALDAGTTANIRCVR